MGRHSLPKKQFLVTRKSDGKLVLWVHTLIKRSGQRGGFSLKRFEVGTFHTMRGAEAYAAIMAGEQPFSVTRDITV